MAHKQTEATKQKLKEAFARNKAKGVKVGNPTFEIKTALPKNLLNK